MREKKRSRDWAVWLAALEAVAIALLSILLIRQTGSVQPIAQKRDPGATPADIDAARVRLSSASQRVAELSRELARLKNEAPPRPEELSFSYGTPTEAGRFVGDTLATLLTLAQRARNGEAYWKDTDIHGLELRVLSVGPFIQEAEALESDPAVFGRFQAALVGRMLGFDESREKLLETSLRKLKTQAALHPVGSSEWSALDQEARDVVASLLTESERAESGERLAFVRENGLLLLPTTAILAHAHRMTVFAEEAEDAFQSEGTQGGSTSEARQPR